MTTDNLNYEQIARFVEEYNRVRESIENYAKVHGIILPCDWEEFYLYLSKDKNIDEKLHDRRFTIDRQWFYDFHRSNIINSSEEEIDVTTCNDAPWKITIKD
jgi:hypothetical protein